MPEARVGAAATSATTRTSTTAWWWGSRDDQVGRLSLGGDGGRGRCVPRPPGDFTNDRYPRSRAEWTCEGIVIKRGASVGAGAVVLPGVTIGERAMVGAGAVVTKDVEPGAVVVGNPARVVSRFEARRHDGAAGQRRRPDLQPGGFIRETIESVLDQAYPNLELVLSDDGSTDGTGRHPARVRGARPGRVTRRRARPTRASRVRSTARSTRTPVTTSPGSAATTSCSPASSTARWLCSGQTRRGRLLPRRGRVRFRLGDVVWTVL